MGLINRLNAYFARTELEKEEILDSSEVRHALTTFSRDLSRLYRKSKNPQTKRIRDKARRVALEVGELHNIIKSLEKKRDKLFEDILPILRDWIMLAKSQKEKKEKSRLKAKLLRKKEMANILLSKTKNGRNKTTKLMKDIHSHLRELNKMDVTLAHGGGKLTVKDISLSIRKYELVINRTFEEIETVVKPAISDMVNIVFARHEKASKDNLLRVGSNYV